MASIFTIARRFACDEEGAAAVEYALIAGLIAVAIIVGAGTLGTSLNANFEEIGNYLGSISVP
jgi:pilus assembly protein Flp/PilA